MDRKLKNKSKGGKFSPVKCIFKKLISVNRPFNMTILIM